MLLLTLLLADPGLFARQADVGAVRRPGAVAFDPAAKTYTVTGGGENMWGAADAFQFVWREWAGDVSLAADIRFEGAGKDPHRKACLMIRQSLDPDAAYVDVAVHGDGLTSLQFRDSKGARTQEVQATVKSPVRAKLVRAGQVRPALSGRRRRGAGVHRLRRAGRVRRPGAWSASACAPTTKRRPRRRCSRTSNSLRRPRPPASRRW